MTVKEVKKILGEKKITDHEFFELKAKLFGLKAKSNKKEYSIEEAEMMKYAKFLLELGFSSTEASKIIKEKWNNKEELIDYILIEIDNKVSELNVLKAKMDYLKHAMKNKEQILFSNENDLEQIILSSDVLKDNYKKIEEEMKELGNKYENSDENKKKKTEDSIKNLLYTMKKFNESSVAYDEQVVKNTLFLFEREMDNCLGIKIKRYMLSTSMIIGSYKELREILDEEINGAASEYLAKAIQEVYFNEIYDKISTIVKTIKEDADFDKHINEYGKELVELVSEYSFVYNSDDALVFYENMDKGLYIRIKEEDENLNYCIKVLKKIII